MKTHMIMRQVRLYVGYTYWHQRGKSTDDTSSRSVAKWGSWQTPATCLASVSPTWWPRYCRIELWLTMDCWVDIQLGHWITFKRINKSTIRTLCLFPPPKRLHACIVLLSVGLSVWMRAKSVNQLWINFHKILNGVDEKSKEMWRVIWIRIRIINFFAYL